MKLNYLDLNTAHLKYETMELLELDNSARNQMGWPAMSVANYEYGVFLTVPEPEVIKEVQAATLIGTFPSEFAELLTYASKQECSVVRLDAAGMYAEELETFEW